jgi:hypothetical protein
MVYSVYGLLEINSKAVREPASEAVIWNDG